MTDGEGGHSGALDPNPWVTRIDSKTCKTFSKTCKTFVNQFYMPLLVKCNKLTVKPVIFKTKVVRTQNASLSNCWATFYSCLLLRFFTQDVPICMMGTLMVCCCLGT